MGQTFLLSQSCYIPVSLVGDSAALVKQSKQCRVRFKLGIASRHRSGRHQRSSSVRYAKENSERPSSQRVTLTHMAGCLFFVRILWIDIYIYILICCPGFDDTVSEYGVDLNVHPSNHSFSMFWYVLDTQCWGNLLSLLGRSCCWEMSLMLGFLSCGMKQTVPNNHLVFTKTYLMIPSSTCICVSYLEVVHDLPVALTILFNRGQVGTGVECWWKGEGYRKKL